MTDARVGREVSLDNAAWASGGQRAERVHTRVHVSAAGHSQRQNSTAQWEVSSLPTSYKGRQDHSTVRALSSPFALGKRGTRLVYPKAIHYLGKLFLKNSKNYVETGAADPRPRHVMTGMGFHRRGRCPVIARLWSPGADVHAAYKVICQENAMLSIVIF